MLELGNTLIRTNNEYDLKLTNLSRLIDNKSNFYRIITYTLVLCVHYFLVIIVYSSPLIYAERA